LTIGFWAVFYREIWKGTACRSLAIGKPVESKIGKGDKTVSVFVKETETVDDSNPITEN
jgi:hypothetical protein